MAGEGWSAKRDLHVPEREINSQASTNHAPVQGHRKTSRRASEEAEETDNPTEESCVERKKGHGEQI
jgi:hypothetical protein